MRKRLPERIPQVQLAVSHNTVKGPAFVYTNDEYGFQQLAFREIADGPYVVEFRAASLIYGTAFPTYEALRDAVNARIAELEEIDDAEGLDAYADEPVLDAIIAKGADGHAGRAQREPHLSHAWRWTDEGAMQCPCGAVFEDFGEQGHATVGEPFEPCKRAQP